MRKPIVAGLVFVTIIFISWVFLYLSHTSTQTEIGIAEEIEKDGLVNTETTSTLTVKMLGPRTYGRVFLENQNPNSKHRYILAEPDEVVSDGGLRYSPLTEDMKVGNTYEVSGEITQDCFDRYEIIEGEESCIAWMYIDSVIEYE